MKEEMEEENQKEEQADKVVESVAVDNEQVEEKTLNNRAVNPNKSKSFFARLKSKRLDRQSSEKIKATKSKIYNLLDKNKFVNVNDKSRSNAKVTQVVLFAFFMSLIFNFILVNLIIILLPIKEKVPYFVHFMPKDEQIVHVENYKQSKKSQRAIKEFMARDYVSKRETIDLASENDRWQQVIYLSSQGMKDIFLNEYLPDKNPDSPYKYAVDNNIIRRVNIISSSVLNDNQYQVEFEIIDSFRSNGKIIETTIAIATVSFIDNADTFKGQSYLNNPLGYLVDDYSIGIKQKRVEVMEDVKGNNSKVEDNGKKVDTKRDW